MEKKKFDCVDMKRRGAKSVRQATEGMTLEEELLYWQAGTAELLIMQEKARSNEPFSGEFAQRASSDRA